MAAFILGGCVVRDEKTAVVCKTCRYTQLREDEWSKVSSDAGKFDPPLAELVTGFPAPAGAKVHFYRRMQDGVIIEEGRDLTMEGKPDPRHADRLLDWLTQHGVTHITESRASQNFHYDLLKDALPGSRSLRGSRQNESVYGEVVFRPMVTYIYLHRQLEQRIEPGRD